MKHRRNTKFISSINNVEKSVSLPIKKKLRKRRKVQNDEASKMLFDDDPSLDEEFLDASILPNESILFDDFVTNNDENDNFKNDNDIGIFRFFEAGFEDLNDNEKFVFCVLMGAHVTKLSDMISELKFNIIPRFANNIGLNNFLYFVGLLISSINGFIQLSEPQIPLCYNLLSIRFLPFFVKNNISILHISHTLGFQKIPYFIQIFSPIENFHYSIYLNKKKIKALPYDDNLPRLYFINEKQKKTKLIIHISNGECPIIVKIQYVQIKEDTQVAEMILSLLGCNVDVCQELLPNIIAFHHNSKDIIPHQINFMNILNTFKQNTLIKCNICQELLTENNMNFVYPQPNKNLKKENIDKSISLSDESSNEINETNEESNPNKSNDISSLIESINIYEAKDEISNDENDLNLPIKEDTSESFEEDINNDIENILIDEQTTDLQPLTFNNKNFYRIHSYTGSKSNSTNSISRSETILKSNNTPIINHYVYESISVPNIILNDLRLSNMNHPQNQNKSPDPSYIGYLHLEGENLPKSFEDVSKLKFTNNISVHIAISNIAVYQAKSVFCKYSQKDIIEFRCNHCNYKHVWCKNNQYWICSKYLEHSCNINVKRHLKIYIQEAIQMVGINICLLDEGFNRVYNLVKEGCTQTRLKNRIKSMYQKITGIDSPIRYWELIPSYLAKNSINGGKSEMIYIDNTLKITCFAMIPQFGVQLLKSNVIQPLLIIDGIFQSSCGRGTIMIISSMSGNRTILPIGWAWGPSENENTVQIILEMISNIRKDIRTIISDEGTGIKSAIKKIFPKASHQYCAWHIANKLSSKSKSIFWKLVKAEHPVEFMEILTYLRKYDANLYDKITTKSKNIFNKFYDKAPKSGMVSSSPAESINSLIAPHRCDEPILIFNLLDEIGYNKCLDLLELNGEYTPYFNKKIEKLIQKAHNMVVEQKYSTSYKVYDPKKPNCVFNVNLRAASCQCGMIEDYGIPCSHIIAATFHNPAFPYQNYINPFYKISTIKSELKELRHVITVEDLVATPGVEPCFAHNRILPKKRYLFGWEKR